MELMINEQKMNAEKAWEAMAGQLKITMDKQTFATLITPTKFISHKDNIFIISAPNAFTRAWLEERLTETVERLLSGMMGETQKVKFIVGNNIPTEEVKEEASISEKKVVKFALSTNSDHNYFNPRYTFDNFIVGSNNNLACAACRAVAEMPATSYNPLFIYSGVGLGKTHLLHAIGNKLKQNSPEKKVVYVSSEEFTNDFISSIQKNENAAFREKYRTADVLLIDDIQFIIGKESTQEAFFHIFNSLYEMDKQIVITSDRAPKELSTLDERMRSRFEWGLTVDIQPPTFETRLAILSNKAKVVHKDISPEILGIIARQFQSNVRELEGAFNRVIAVSDLCGKTIDQDLISTSLSDLIAVEDEVETDDIIELAAKSFGTTKEKILSPSRVRNVVRARQVVMYLMREEGNISLPQIGQAVGGRDHTTVMHSCNKVISLMETDMSFRKTVMELRDKLYGERKPIAI